MSLLDRNPHWVLVQNRIVVRDGRGERSYTNDGAPIPVRTSVQDVRDWSSVEEDLSHGVVITAMRQIYARTWPGDSNSIVIWDGFEFNTIGDPQHFNMSRRTRHWRVTVQKLGESSLTTGEVDAIIEAYLLEQEGGDPNG